MAKNGGSIGGELRDIWKKNKAEQDARKAAREAGMGKESPMGFASRWIRRLFYTAFAAMAAYLVITVSTLAIPMLVSVLVSVLGYTLANVAEVMLTAFCGLFFVLWGFAISFSIVRAIWKAYVKAMAGTARKPQGQD